MATPKVRSLKETEEWIRTAYVHALEKNGVSARRLARRIGKHRDTTSDWKSGETVASVAQVLRDPDLAEDFLQCLRVEERAARKRERR